MYLYIYIFATCNSSKLDWNEMADVHIEVHSFL